MAADSTARMKTPAGAKPFLFNRSFDRAPATAPKKPAEPAAEREQPEVEAAAPPPEPEAPSFSQEELDAARAEALEEGRAQGLEEARQSQEAANGEVLARMAEALARLDDSARANRAASEAALLRFAGTAFARLMPAYAEAHGEAEILAVMREVAGLILGEAVLSVRLRPDRLTALEPDLQALMGKAGFDGRLKLVGDDELGPSDVAIDWGDGQASRRMERAEAAFAQALEETLRALDPPDPPAPDTADGSPTQPEAEAEHV